MSAHGIILVIAVVLACTHAVPTPQEDCFERPDDLMLLQMRAQVVPKEPASEDDGCKADVKDMVGNKAKASEVDECMQQDGYNDEILTELRHGDRKAAIAKATDACKKCMSLSDNCANETATDYVTTIMLAGEAVEDSCWEEFDKAWTGMKVYPEDCAEAADAKVSEALDKGDMDTALDISAKDYFHKCLTVSTKCSVEFAPTYIHQHMVRKKIEQKEKKAIEENMPSSTQVFFEKVAQDHKAAQLLSAESHQRVSVQILGQELIR